MQDIERQVYLMKKRKDNVNLYNWVHHQQKKQNYSSIVNFIEHITGTTVEKGRPGPDVFNSAVCCTVHILNYTSSSLHVLIRVKAPGQFKLNKNVIILQIM